MLSILENSFHDPSQWDRLRTLENLPAFLTQPTLQPGIKSSVVFSSSRQKGSPHTIIITSAGLRAADIAR